MLTGKKVLGQGISPSHEHYLRAIRTVHARQGYARLADVARELRIAPTTLLQGLMSLERRALVRHDEHRFLTLTPAGDRLARDVHHRFAVIRAFLEEVLGVPVEGVDEEACRLEHELGHDTARRLTDLVKLLREDDALREHLGTRLAEYRLACEASDACSQCDLACVAEESGGPGGAS